MKSNEKILKPIFLDTTVFEECSYDLENKNFELLFHTARQDYGVYITRVNEQELKKHFLFKYKEINNKIEKALDKARITKRYLQKYWDFIPEKTNNQYDEFLTDLTSKRIKIIDTYQQEISVEKIYTDYFENNPPFENNKEFPDALILNSINAYINSNAISAENTFVISKDGHFKEFCESRNIRYFEDIVRFCSWLKNEEYPEKFKEIKDIIKDHLVVITPEVIGQIQSDDFYVGYDDYWLELDLEGVEINKEESYIDDFYIVDFVQADEEYEVTLEVSLSLDAIVTFNGADQNDASWIDKQYYYETKSFDEDKLINLTLIVKLLIEKDGEKFTFSILESSSSNSEEYELRPEYPDPYDHYH